MNRRRLREFTLYIIVAISYKYISYRGNILSISIHDVKNMLNHFNSGNTYWLNPYSRHVRKILTMCRQVEVIRRQRRTIYVFPRRAVREVIDKVAYLPYINSNEKIRQTLHAHHRT